MNCFGTRGPKEPAARSAPLHPPPPGPAIPIWQRCTQIRWPSYLQLHFMALLVKSLSATSYLGLITTWGAEGGMGGAPYLAAEGEAHRAGAPLLLHSGTGFTGLPIPPSLGRRMEGATLHCALHCGNLRPVSGLAAEALQPLHLYPTPTPCPDSQPPKDSAACSRHASPAGCSSQP